MRETADVTTTQAHPTRSLGRGIKNIFPPAVAVEEPDEQRTAPPLTDQPAAPTATDQAAAALAALQTVPVQVGALEAAVVQLEDRARTAPDEATRATALATVAALRAAVAQRG